LIWLVDILKLITNNDVMFRTDLFKRADYLQQGKSLSYTIYLLSRTFDHEIKMGVEHGGQSHGLSRLERGILEARANGQSIDLIGPVTAIFCVQSFSNKVALGWESLFPKNEMVKQEVTGAFRGKSLLYYPGRFCKIFASLLKRFCLILGYIIRG
jgi:hypothetical protein